MGGFPTFPYIFLAREVWENGFHFRISAKRTWLTEAPTAKDHRLKTLNHPRPTHCQVDLVGGNDTGGLLITRLGYAINSKPRLNFL
jgi:hypothetical protein